MNKESTIFLNSTNKFRNFDLTLFSPSFFTTHSVRGGGLRGPPRVFLRKHNCRSKKSKKVSCAQNINYNKIIKVTVSQSCRIIIQRTGLIFRAGGLRGPPSDWIGLNMLFQTSFKNFVVSEMMYKSLDLFRKCHFYVINFQICTNSCWNLHWV